MVSQEVRPTLLVMLYEEELCSLRFASAVVWHEGNDDNDGATAKIREGMVVVCVFVLRLQVQYGMYVTSFPS